MVTSAIVGLPTTTVPGVRSSDMTWDWSAATVISSAEAGVRTAVVAKPDSTARPNILLMAVM